MADFAYSPDFKYTVKPDYNVVISEHENDSEERRLIHSRKIREFNLKFTNRSSTEFAAVNTFFDLQKGALTAFTMDIDGEEVTVRFVPNSFYSSPVAYLVYDYGFQAKEVVS